MFRAPTTLPSTTTTPSAATRVLRGLSILCSAALVGGSLLAWSARWFWLGEVAVSFTWHLGLVSLAAALALALARNLRSSALALCLAAVHLAPELSLWLPRGQLESEVQARRVLTVASCNLLWSNRQHAELGDWLDEIEADIIAFQEVSPAWRAVLEAQSERYPTLVLSPAPEQWQPGTWGTAVLARVPLRGFRLIPQPRGVSRPLMEVTTELAGRPLVLRSAHTQRPGSAWRTRERNAVLRVLERQDWSGSALLIGDLNLTSSSPVFGDLLQATGLRDSRAGFGRQPTFTTARPIRGLSIAIDHVLVSDAIRVLDRHTRTLPGSDHRSVIVRLTVPPEKPASIGHALRPRPGSGIRPRRTQEPR